MRAAGAPPRRRGALVPALASGCCLAGPLGAPRQFVASPRPRKWASGPGRPVGSRRPGEAARRRRVSDRVLDADFWQELSEETAFDGLGACEAEFCATPRSFDHRRWRAHASSTRYVRDVPGLIYGRTTARILPIILLLVIFSSGVELYSYLAARMDNLVEFQLPAAPFEFTAPLLGLLLVFRTNSSYLRYVAACRAVQRISGELTSLIRQLLSWSDGESRRPAEVDRIVDDVVDYHSWLFTGYLVSQDVPEACEEGGASLARLSARLAMPPGAPLTPAQVSMMLAWKINQLRHLTVFQRKDLDNTLVVVTRELSDCEQLLRSPIPLAYTRSLRRFLWLWLSLLPFSLIKTFTDFGQGTWWEGQPLYIVPIAVAFISLVFLSIEDIAVQIEEPFVVQRLQLQRLACWFRDDALDMRRVVRALEAERQ